jgi:hypothetical protein
MDMDVENLCAAGYAERSAERQNSRTAWSVTTRPEATGTAHCE